MRMIIDTNELRRQAKAMQTDIEGCIQVNRTVLLLLLDRIDELERHPINLDPSNDRWYP